MTARASPARRWGARASSPARSRRAGRRSSARSARCERRQERTDLVSAQGRLAVRCRDGSRRWGRVVIAPIGHRRRPPPDFAGGGVIPILPLAGEVSAQRTEGGGLESLPFFFPPPPPPP